MGRLREYAYAFSGLAPASCDVSHDIVQPWCMPILDRVVSWRFLFADSLRFLVVSAWGYDVTMNDRELARGGYIGKLYVPRRKLLRDPHIQHLAISRFMADRLKPLVVPPQQITLHYAGIDTSAFDRAPKRSVSQSCCSSVGWWPKRDASTCCRDGSPAKNAVGAPGDGGDGPLRAISRTSRQAPCAVDFLGAQSSDVVAEWMRRASVLCVPSITAPNGDSEGLPTVCRGKLGFRGRIAMPASPRR